MNKELVRLFHKKNNKKIETTTTLSLKNDDMSILYTPGVSLICKDIFAEEKKANIYTSKKNNVAVVSDGSAVLGLGNIGGLASLPVMESKCIFLKELANVSSFPICLNNQEKSSIIETVKNIEPSFGAIMLEDIAAPQCFEVEAKLNESLPIPVVHADQHGTSIIVCAALLNALKLVDKNIREIKIVVCGTGASGTAVIRLLKALGASNIIAFDEHGMVSTKVNRPLYDYQKDLITECLVESEGDDLSMNQTIIDADVFIGLSTGAIISKEMVSSMSDQSIVFALAGPIPEISYDDAISAGATIAATGSSNKPNQINNVSVFPGLMKGLLEYDISDLSMELQVEIVLAITKMKKDADLSYMRVLDDAFSEEYVAVIVEAIKNYSGK